MATPSKLDKAKTRLVINEPFYATIVRSMHTVLVTNADPTLKAQLADAPGDSLYLARGGHLGMNGNYSAGILEGLAHYRADARQWLAQEHERGFEQARLPV